MAKKNFYAVATGSVPGIYTTWNECEKQIKGYSGAKYKGFVTIEEAQQFMLDNCSSYNLDKEATNIQYKEVSINKGEAILNKKEEVTFIKSKATNIKEITDYIEVEEKIKEEDVAIFFIDGSYDKTTKIYGSGIVLIDNNLNNRGYIAAGIDTYNQWNIIGEIEACKVAIDIALSLPEKKKKIVIYHDLEGTAKWANGNFRAKNDYTKSYVKFIEEKSKDIDIEFIKVKGHSGNKYNDLADEYAKYAIKDYKENNNI